MTRKPFAVSNGRPASKFAEASTSPKPKIVLLNGKPCGGGFISDDKECKSGVGSSVSDDDNRAIVGSPAYRKFMEEGDAKGYNAKELVKYRSAESGDYHAERAEKAKDDGEKIRRHGEAAAHYEQAAKDDPTNASIYREKADKHWKEHKRLDSLHNHKSVANAGNSEGAHKGWLTRKGGMREDHNYVDEAGVPKTKLTIQAQQDGQKDIEVHLPTATLDAIKSGKWEANKDWSKHAGSENFHVVHGYNPVGDYRQKYAKGSESDKHNSNVGRDIGRANSYYMRARDYDKSELPHKVLTAKAEEALAAVHGEHHPKRKAAEAAHAAMQPVGNRAYHSLLNSFKAGAILNYVSRDADVDDLDDDEVIELAGEYAASGDTMPDDLLERLEEIMSNREQGTEAIANRNVTRFK